MDFKKSIRFLTVKSVGLYINCLSYINPKKALQLSYALFSEPRIGRLQKDNLPEFLQETQSDTHSHEEHFFQTYVWEGNDHKILLVHGWESNSSRWQKTMPYLQKAGSTIIALDAPAHGQSSGKEFNVPLYAQFIQKTVQKYQPNIIIGHSIGGIACVYHQHLFPETSIEKMVILGAPSDLRTLLNNYVNLLSLNKKNYALLENRFKTHFNFKVEDFSGKIFSKNITIDGLLAHDTEDDVVAFSEGEKIVSNWKNCEFVTTKGLGHGMHDDALYQKVADFLFEETLTA